MELAEVYRLAKGCTSYSEFGSVIDKKINNSPESAISCNEFELIGKNKINIESIMIITKEQQEKILVQYVEDKHNTDECIGFIDGINATIELINKLTINKNTEKDFGKKMREACTKASKSMEETGKLLRKLNVKEKVNRSKFHS